jgi:hypothetical protein
MAGLGREPESSSSLLTLTAALMACRARWTWVRTVDAVTPRTDAASSAVISA